jgi:hypothetical protein
MQTATKTVTTGQQESPQKQQLQKSCRHQFAAFGMPQHLVCRSVWYAAAFVIERTLPP